MSSERTADGKYRIPPGTAPQSCKGCSAAIYWVITAAGKRMPCDPDGAPHWASCPQAKQFKKGSPK